VFIDMAATDYLKRKLANSRFGSNEYIADIIGEFERKTVRPSPFNSFKALTFFSETKV